MARWVRTMAGDIVNLDRAPEIRVKCAALGGFRLEIVTGRERCVELATGFPSEAAAAHALREIIAGRHSVCMNGRRRPDARR